MINFAELKDGLSEHLDDDLRWHEIGTEQIQDKIEQVDVRHCEAELRIVLSEQKFQNLKSTNFQPIRDALSKLFARWL
jgi:hypothetical protein